MANVPIRVEWIDTVRDMPALLELENANSQPKAAWTQVDFLEELTTKNVCGFAAWRGQVLTGFYLYHLSKYNVLVLNIKGEPAAIRALLNKLKVKLAKGMRSTILISVRESELSLQLLLKEENFVATSVIREQFLDTEEDGYVFKYEAPDKLQVVVSKGFVDSIV